MKNFISLFFIGMFINMSLAQTNTFTVYYFDAKPGTQSALADVYDDFFEGVEFKSGGLYFCLLYTSPSPRDSV